ncbi:MAG: terminase gpA endonuclease subunit, partial [Solimonas sp.]
FIHLPSWLPQSFFDEMFRAEVRLPNGTWQQIRKRNEAFDLAAYIRAGCLRFHLDKLDWSSAPPWARPLAENSELITVEDRREMQDNTPLQTAAPAEPPASPPRARRVSRSSYL